MRQLRSLQKKKPAESQSISKVERKGESDEFSTSSAREIEGENYRVERETRTITETDQRIREEAEMQTRLSNQERKCCFLEGPARLRADSWGLGEAQKAQI